MKKILVLMLFAGIVFTGCTDVKINNVSPPTKGTYSLIPIPEKTGLYSEADFTTTSTIDGATGGTMTMNQSYWGNNGHLVTISLSMIIPPGAFSGVKTITLTADDQYAALICTPAMVFDLNLTLNFSYTGLSLNRQSISHYRQGFYFMPNSGVPDEVNNSGVEINRLLGKVKVIDAKISHFSRYGWATLDGDDN